MTPEAEYEPERKKKAGSPARSQPDFLDRAIFLIVTGVIVGIAATMAFTYLAQYKSYQRLISAQTKVIEKVVADPDSDAEDFPADFTVLPLMYLRESELSLLRISSVFISFVLTYIGALYVLRTAQSAFKASIEGGSVKGALSTSSPGLVLAALGVGLFLSTLRWLPITPVRLPF